MRAGSTVTAEHRAKISASMTGRKLSAATRDKMSAARRGRAQLSAISAAKRRFAIGDVCLHCKTVMVEGTTAYVRRHRGAEYVVCLARWRETRARLRAERGLPPLRPRGPKSPKPPKPEPGARGWIDAPPYKKVSAAAVMSRGRWRSVLVLDDGKGGRERRTSSRSYATSDQARAAADRMRARAEAS